jgi:hypothetical protein
MARLRLQLRSTINKKSFTVDDEVEDAPLLKVEFIDEFFTRIPPDVRDRVGMKMLKYGLKLLEEEANQQVDGRLRYDPAEGF